MLPGPQSIHDAHGDTAHYTWPTTHVNIELFVSYFSWVLVLVLVFKHWRVNDARLFLKEPRTLYRFTDSFFISQRGLFPKEVHCFLHSAQKGLKFCVIRCNLGLTLSFSVGK